REIRRNCRARRYPREAPQEPPSRRPAAALRRYRKGGRRRKSRIVIARSEATRQSTGLGGRTGLLRFARNDGLNGGKRAATSRGGGRRPGGRSRPAPRLLRPGRRGRRGGGAQPLTPPTGRRR